MKISFTRNPLQLISLFLLGVVMFAPLAGISTARLVNDALIRLGMNGVFTLSLVPMLKVGAGLNFGLAIGIIAGLLAMAFAVNAGLNGFGGWLFALLLVLPLAAALGALYGKVLNRVKGNEETAGIFAGFSVTFLMNIFWAAAPFSNPVLLWPIGGQGMRPAVNLQPYFAKVLNDLLIVDAGDLRLPVGLLAAFLSLCLIVQLFFRTRIGLAMSSAGENEKFAVLNGVDIKKMRIFAVMLSTLLAAVGICFYAQGYGFIEFYEAPLYFGFPAASAILLGGYDGKNATVSQVIFGTMVFQAIYVFTGPLANALLLPQLSEAIRMLITNGVILYSLFYHGRNRLRDTK